MSVFERKARRFRSLVILAGIVLGSSIYMAVLITHSPSPPLEAYVVGFAIGGVIGAAIGAVIAWAILSCFSFLAGLFRDLIGIDITERDYEPRHRDKVGRGQRR